MKKKFQLLLIFLGFSVPYLLIYKSFFLSGPLAFGDAPFFAPENLKELFNLPYLWNFRHDNFGSPQYYILWLYLPTYIYGVLNYFLGLGNDILVRIIFYFPATILAIIGSWKFIGKFTQNIPGKFLGSFLYGFNTYFLMLVDGGQVGVALAYGLFPLTAVSILSYLGNFSIKNYLFALFTLFALVSSDIRIALILLVFVGAIWVVQGTRGFLEELKGLLILGLSVFGLSSYWVIPVLDSSGLFGGLGEFGGLSSGTNFISLSNSLFLFQPHFPLNQFGKTVPTPFYFTLILPLILGGLILKSKNYLQKRMIFRFSLIFLITVFFAKGGSDPLGGLYSWFVNLPGGVAFRDSSKFYIPLMLIGGLLLSFTVSSLISLTKRKLVWVALLTGIYTYLLLLIYPAVLGNLSGVLGELREDRENNYQQIYKYLQKDNGFGRILYFEEKPSQFYGSWDKPAVSANNLYKDRPFASMIVGKYDFFNYVYNPQFCQWLDLLGVRYIFLPDQERKKILDQKEEVFQNKLRNTINNISCLSSLNLTTSFPLYMTTTNKPAIFAQKRAFLVVGGEGIYDKLMKNQNFSLSKQGFIFAEDGKVNIRKLANLNSENLVLLFDGKELIDLQMTYFIDKMVSPNKAWVKEWKIYGSDDYLIWKYELLKSDVNTKEFDFGKGVAVSTIAGEIIKFKLPVVSSGRHYLAVRFTNSLEGGLILKSGGKEYNLHNQKPENFKWEIVGPINIEGDNEEVEIINKGNLALLNTVAMIPEGQLEIINQKAEQLTKRYKTIYSKDRLGDLVNLGGLPLEIGYQRVNPTEYKLTNLPDYPVWLVFSDHYDAGWILKDTSEDTHVPFYAMINGYYLDKKLSDLTLFYSPQERVGLGVLSSLASLVAICLTASVVILRKKIKR